MYSAREFGAMISDQARMSAYQAAIEQSVRQGDVVVDLGAGTGVLSLLAAKAGASHVYAIETNALVERGPALALANGYQDRITFVRGDALEFIPDRQVDVVIGDVRGSLPVVSGLDLYKDAAERYMRPGGRTIPLRDEVFVAPLSRPDAYRVYVHEPWARNDLGLDLTPELQAATVSPVNAKLRDRDGLLEPKLWGVFDYTSALATFDDQVFAWSVADPATLHFLAVWFDAVLAPGISYSSAPGADGPTVYGQILLPLERPLTVEPDDTVEVQMRTNANYSVWSWNTEVHRGGQRVERLRQSTLGTIDIDAIRKHRDGVTA